MLHYSTHLHPNSKTWVTFVHGAGGSSSIWFKQLREFSKHFNVLLLDLRGHGKSRMQLTNVFKKKYTFDVLAEDIIAVLDKENIKSSHFVGISLGTILIRQIGEMYPQTCTEYGDGWCDYETQCALTDFDAFWEHL